MSGDLCGVCDLPFTDDEWFDRHGELDDVHADCCVDCKNIIGWIVADANHPDGAVVFDDKFEADEYAALNGVFCALPLTEGSVFADA